MSSKGAQYESVVRIDAVVYKRFAEYCRQHGLIVGGIVSRLVAGYLAQPSLFSNVVQPPSKEKTNARKKSKTAR